MSYLERMLPFDVTRDDRERLDQSPERLFEAFLRAFAKYSSGSRFMATTFWSISADHPIIAVISTTSTVD